MNKTELICRFCLKIPECEPFVTDEATRDRFGILQIQLDFDVFEHNVICKDCSETIEKVSDFKSMCAHTQDLILLSSVHENRTNTDLRSIYRMKTDLPLDRDEDICRLCMKPSRDVDLVSIATLIDDSAFVEMWTKYMSGVNLNITSNPKLCPHCKQNLQDYLKFVSDIEVVERKINTYRETQEDGNLKPLVLSKALSYLCVDNLVDTVKSEKDEVTKEPDDILKQEYEQIPKLEHELDIKEEKLDYKEHISENYPISKSETRDLEHTRISEDRLLDKASNLRFTSRKTRKTSKPTKNIVTEDKPHKCVKCNYSTNKVKNLRRHMSMHINPSKKCPQCSYSAHQQYTLDSHIRKKHTALNCIKCTFTTTNRAVFNRHLITHSDKIDVFQCPICCYQTNWLYMHKKHVSKHSNSASQVFRCFHCDYETFFKTHLRNHMLTHDGEASRYTCELCPYSSDELSEFEKHKLCHEDGDEEIRKCTVCDFTTKHKDDLAIHVETHRKQSKTDIFKCLECRYQTLEKEEIKLHVETHIDNSEEQKYCCGLCKFTAKVKTDLMKHVFKHNREVRTYLCWFCTFISKNRERFDCYVLSKKDISEKHVYDCTVCEYKTKYKNSLVIHQQMHELKAEGNLFKCSFEACSFETYREDYLKKHIAKMHRNEIRSSITSNASEVQAIM